MALCFSFIAAWAERSLDVKPGASQSAEGHGGGLLLLPFWIHREGTSGGLSPERAGAELSGEGALTPQAFFWSQLSSHTTSPSHAVLACALAPIPITICSRYLEWRPLGEFRGSPGAGTEAGLGACWGSLSPAQHKTLIPWPSLCLWCTGGDFCKKLVEVFNAYISNAEWDVSWITILTKCMKSSYWNSRKKTSIHIRLFLKYMLQIDPKEIIDTEDWLSASRI